MLKKIKKFFIPHKHNNYHPHIFRNVSIIFIFCITAFLLGISYANNYLLKETVLGVNISSNVLIDLANESRSKSKIAPLKRDKRLDYAASLKVKDMISNKYFSHNSPEGVTPWYFINQSGYNFLYAGENLAINFSESKDVQEAWMKSESHKANLLNSNFQDIGIATKEGIYNGKPTVYIVQLFGKEKFNNPFIMKPKLEVLEDSRLTNSNLKVIQENENFIAVKNLDYQFEKEDNQVLGAETYSSIFDIIIFNLSYYIQLIFLIILFVLIIAFIIRIFVEYRKQHRKHFIQSIFILTFLIFASYLNFFFLII